MQQAAWMENVRNYSSFPIGIYTSTFPSLVTYREMVLQMLSASDAVNLEEERVANVDLTVF